MKQLITTIILCIMCFNIKAQNTSFTASSPFTASSLYSIDSNANTIHVQKHNIFVFTEENNIVAQVDTSGILTVNDSLATIKALMKFLGVEIKGCALSHEDSLIKEINEYLDSADTITLQSTYTTTTYTPVSNWFNVNVRYDTTACFLLVADTLNTIQPVMFWVKGYSVIDKYTYTRTYLDADKKSLDKGIMVAGIF